MDGDSTPTAGTARFGWHDLVRVWSSASNGRRLRRPTDIILLVGSVLVLVPVGLLAPGPTNVDTAIVQLFGAFPPAMTLVWSLSYTVLTVWALVLLVLPIFFRGRRRLIGDFGLAALLAMGASLAAGQLAGTPVDATWNALVQVPDSPVYVAVRVALATAVIVTASPHVSRPLRYWGRIVIVLGAVAAVGLGAAYPIGVVAGASIGVGAAALTHLILGSPQGLLTAEQVEIALTDLGVDADASADQVDQVAGEVLWRAKRPDGTALQVKV